jgi:hypothetical protein
MHVYICELATTRPSVPHTHIHMRAQEETHFKAQEAPEEDFQAYMSSRQS